MSYLITSAYSAETTAVVADPAAKPESGFDPIQFMPFIFIFVVFYFLILRPQQRKFKLHQAMVTSIARGDKVVTSGGVHGKVTKVDDDGTIQVEIANGVVVKVVAATVSHVVGDKPTNDNVVEAKAKKN